MNKLRTMLQQEILDPAAGGGGGSGYDFRNDLPEDIRKDPVFDSIKAKDAKEAFGLLGKGYVHAQRMIGTNRLPKPQKDWTPDKWAAFNKELGVPDDHTQYGTPEFKFRDGVKIVPEKLDGYKKLFKELGLRPDQAAKLQEEYFKDVDGAAGQYESERTSAKARTEAAIKEKYGDQYEAKIDIGRSVIKKYGSETLLQSLAQSGAMDNPDVIDFIVKVGEDMMEDTSNGDGSPLPIGNRAKAMQEIGNMKTDKEVQEAMNNRNHPGHKAMVEKWLSLHKVAYPDQTVSN
jgi:hypothetical protein